MSLRRYSLHKHRAQRPHYQDLCQCQCREMLVGPREGWGFGWSEGRLGIWLERGKARDLVGAREGWGFGWSEGKLGIWLERGKAGDLVGARES